jgi:hypothetical protein
MADHPRTIEEIVAAEEPAERDLQERAETFQDPGFAGPIRRVTVIEDQRRNGEWVVEYFDADGAPYTTIFAGPEAERRARDYFRALRSGAVKTVREGTTEH